MSDAFDDPRIDVEEWRDEPCRHLYVHGGFAGTDARFSFSFPPAEAYEGRFFQHFTPAPDSEDLAQGLRGQEDRIGFAASSGAYFVETNSGGVSGGPGSDVDPAIAGYRVNAAAAQFSRVVAQRVYGHEHRPFGYGYGGSGGAYRTFGAAEATRDVWDGFVPYVAGSPMAAPNVFTVRMHAQRVLRDRLDDIADAVEPGGTGDPYRGLSDEEAAALREVTAMGFPLRSWFGHRTMGTQAFGVLYPGIRTADPDYFRAFWTEPGYLGADPTSSVHADRVQLTTTVTDVVRRRDGVDLGPLDEHADGPRGGVDEAFKGSGPLGDSIVALRMTDREEGWVRGAELRVLGGAAAGATATLRGLHGDLAVLDFPELAADGLVGIAIGDPISIDNSNFLAAQTYHRHQVPGPEYPVYDLFRADDGTPLPPQRPTLLAPLFATGAAGHVPTGAFHGRMILVESLFDREAFPWQADWYRARAAEHHDDLDDRFRVWIVDRALHGDISAQEHETQTVSYLGVLHEALRDVAAWVERGIPAPLSTCYEIEGGQLSLPPSAAERLGVQPVPVLRVDGAERADVGVGQEVEVALTAEVPQHVGAIVRVAWDLDGDGVFERFDDVDPCERIELTVRTALDTPGTRFVAARVSAQRERDRGTEFGRIDGISRARVVAR